MKTIFQKISHLFGGNSNLQEKINPAEGSAKIERSVFSMNPTEVVTGASPHRIHSPLSSPRHWGRIRSYAEEEANHDLWVEDLSPWAVACAARDLAPPLRSRWRLRQKERPPTAYEIWRVERHAALMRRMESHRNPELTRTAR